MRGGLRGSPRFVLEAQKFVSRFPLFEDGKSRSLALRNELGGGAVKCLTPEG
jgi:hypothetical protein